MKLIDFMAVCKTNDIAAVAEAMVKGWGLDLATATASAQQWVPNFRGFMAQGMLMTLYGDIQSGEDAKATEALTGYFELDAASAPTAIAAIRSTFD